MARPAGVPGMFGSISPKVDFTYGVPLRNTMALQEHALKRFAPYALQASPGWAAPGLEPSIKPKSSVTGAGVVSAGSIDNTYLPKPLNNAWGKARERATNEAFKPPHKQATDLLLVAKGAKLPIPFQGVEEMGSVRPLYSRTIPLFHSIDPMRVDSGFVRSPNIIPGAQPPPQSAMMGVTDTPTVPQDHKLLKLAYDQSMHGSGRIPVARIVRAGECCLLLPIIYPPLLAAPQGSPFHGLASSLLIVADKWTPCLALLHRARRRPAPAERRARIYPPRGGPPRRPLYHKRMMTLDGA